MLPFSVRENSYRKKLRIPMNSAFPLERDFDNFDTSMKGSPWEKNEAGQVEKT
jgi:hypothetical protein